MGYPTETYLELVKVDAVRWLVARVGKSEAEAEALASVLDDQVPELLNLAWFDVLGMVCAQDVDAYRFHCQLRTQGCQRIMDNAKTDTTNIDSHFMSATYFAVIGWLVGVAGVEYSRAEDLAQRIYTDPKAVVEGSFGIAVELAVEKDEKLHAFFKEYVAANPKIFDKDESR